MKCFSSSLLFILLIILTQGCSLVYSTDPTKSCRKEYRQIDGQIWRIEIEAYDSNEELLFTQQGNLQPVSYESVSYSSTGVLERDFGFAGTLEPKGVFQRTRANKDTVEVPPPWSQQNSVFAAGYGAECSWQNRKPNTLSIGLSPRFFDGLEKTPDFTEFMEENLSECTIDFDEENAFRLERRTTWCSTPFWDHINGLQITLTPIEDSQ